MWKPLLIEGQEVFLTALPLYHIFAFTANLMIFYRLRRPQHPDPEPAAAGQLKTVMTDASRSRGLPASTRCLPALMHEPWFQQKKRLDAEGHRWPAAWRWCRRSASAGKR